MPEWSNFNRRLVHLPLEERRTGTASIICLVIFAHEPSSHSATRSWITPQCSKSLDQTENTSPSPTSRTARRMILDLIVKILSEHGWQMFTKANCHHFRNGDRAHDRSALATSQKLSMLRAWLAQSQHRYDQVGTLLEEAETQHQARNIELDTSNNKASTTPYVHR